MEVKRDILWRVYLSFLGIVVISLVILGRAVYIQQAQGAYWRSKSDSLHQKYIELAAERGTIYSEDGSMLSTSVPYFDIYIDFGAEGLREKGGARFKKLVDSLSVSLAGLFLDRPSSYYSKLLREGWRKKDRYFSLKKNLSFDQYQRMRDFPLVNLGRNKSGFIVEVKSKRLNPFGLLANRTIGLARKNAQNVGLERTYDSLLKGESGSKLVRYIAGGVAMPVEGYQIDPENGKDIITTLDVNIQDIAENALMKMMIENECEHGTCIVMEVATGKIKAVANLGKGTGKNYWEDLNYAIRASEPGSTFKLATMLSLLEDKHCKLTDLVNLEGGTWKVNGRTVYDSEDHGYVVTVKEAFEHSSNVGMAKLAMNGYAKNPSQFVAHLKKLHFNEPSGVGLVGETYPVIKSPASKTWSATSLPWMAFGYEVLVSPLQTLMLYNAVANGGRMMKPYLVSAIQNNSLTVKENKPEVVEESVCSAETLEQLKACLEGVMLEGTGKALQNPYYKIAGKTGTALVANGRHGYADHIYQSSFAGYFPADHPQYSCIVVIKNKPYASKFYGAAVAGPVFKEIADKLYASYVNTTGATGKINMNKDSSNYYYAASTHDVREIMQAMQLQYKDSAGQNEWSSIYASDQQTVVSTKTVGRQAVPNLKGMGLKDALYLLEKMNVRVVPVGKGRVVRQSVDPGSPLPKASMTVWLE
ncbi:MAG: transpeptidase family protein [Williamsia sp.]|nr:transpeptidase family protein [Williamsia sp.]